MSKFFYYLSIAERKNVLSDWKIDFCKAFDDFSAIVSPRVLKIEYFFFFQLIDNKKIEWVTICQLSV